MQVLSREQLVGRAFLRLVNVTFTYRKFNGSVSKPVERIVLERGDSVGMLLHDVQRDEVILVEQVRMPTLATGNGMLMEVPAGVIDGHDSAEATAMREIKEETGAPPATLERIAAFYLSPGACSERVHLFYAPYPEGLEVKENAGLETEDEDIRVWRIPLAEAFTMICDGRIQDAKTIVALLWLKVR